MSEPVSAPVPSFADLGLDGDLIRALARRGITEPFPIQAASLPGSLAGRDVLGRGRTGSGKTVAFALPVVSRLLASTSRRRPHHPRALILVPTRELAVQVAETVEFLAHAVGLSTMTVFGGVRYGAQLRKLERGVDVVIATPGRLEDLIDQGACDLTNVEITVLDEADLMADMGFLPPVIRILDQVPADGQRMLFSATLDNEVATLVKTYLHDPLEHAVDADRANPDTQHHLLLVTQANKLGVLTELVTGGGRTLAFTRTKTFAERLARELSEAGIPALDLHGNLKQGARQRHLAAFADGKISVLVATDIAARGIHVDDIGLVVHVDPPADPKAFLHRSGRTARAGAEGVVVTLCTKNQNKGVRGLMAQVKIKPVQTVVEPGHELIAQIRPARLAPPVRRGASMFEPDPADLPDEAPERSYRGGRQAERGRPARVGHEAGDRPARRRDATPPQRRWEERPAGRREDERRPQRPWEDRPAARRTDDRPARPSTQQWEDRPPRREDARGDARTERRARRPDDRPARQWEERPARQAASRPAKQREERPARTWEERPAKAAASRPARQWEERPAKQWEERPAQQWEERPAAAGSRRNNARADAWAELDGRPAPFEERRGPARPAAAATGDRKPRWTSEDRRKADAHREWRAEAGLPARGGKPTRAKPVKAKRAKAAGKPKKKRA